MGESKIVEGKRERPIERDSDIQGEGESKIVEEGERETDRETARYRERERESQMVDKEINGVRLGERETEK